MRLFEQFSDDITEGSLFEVNAIYFSQCITFSVREAQHKIDMMCFLLAETCLMKCQPLETQKEGDQDFEEYLRKKNHELQALSQTQPTLTKLCIFEVRKNMPCKATETFESLEIPVHLKSQLTFEDVAVKIAAMFLLWTTKLVQNADVFIH